MGYRIGMDFLVYFLLKNLIECQIGGDCSAKKAVVKLNKL